MRLTIQENEWSYSKLINNSKYLNEIMLKSFVDVFGMYQIKQQRKNGNWIDWKTDHGWTHEWLFSITQMGQGCGAR